MEVLFAEICETAFENVIDSDFQETRASRIPNKANTIHMQGRQF